MAEIRIENLFKVFPNGTVAVDGVSLNIADGEFFVLLGPSGCGKTTTLRCVAGLERQTEGDISIGERLVNDLPPADRDIAFVFQFYALYPHMKAYDNIAFPLRAAGVSKDKVDARVHEVARTLKIEYALDRRPKRLSSGEQQRVALGRAMVRRPHVFLLDEPLTNLDASLRADLRVELKRLQHELATTTLYVTHDQTEAMSMGHRIAVMDAGKLQQVGTPMEVYDRPATLFVAGFIGSPPMNFVDVTLEDGPALVNSTGEFRLSIDGARVDGLPMKTPLKLGVRSENLHIDPDPSLGDMPAEVYVCEPLGDETVYGLRFAGDHVLLAKAPPTLELDTGQNVGVSFDRAHIHVFDVESGKALGGHRRRPPLDGY